MIRQGREFDPRSDQPILFLPIVLPHHLQIICLWIDIVRGWNFVSSFFWSSLGHMEIRVWWASFNAEATKRLHFVVEWVYIMERSRTVIIPSALCATGSSYYLSHTLNRATSWTHVGSTTTSHRDGTGTPTTPRCSLFCLPLLFFKTPRSIFLYHTLPFCVLATGKL